VIGALGDIHGAFDAARAIIARHPEVPFWLCVGDIADEQGRYESLGAPVYWIHGNNDNLELIYLDQWGAWGSTDVAPVMSGLFPSDLHYLESGARYEIQGLSIVGLGGTFAPTWYDTPAKDLPHPKKGTARATALADKRRHFTSEEVEMCEVLRDVDIFLSHEAPKPFRPFPGGRGPDAGKAQINGILASMKPRLHLFGHHHRYSEQVVEGVRSIGLDLAERSYVLIDPQTLDVTRQP
jgi:Icc-related predicted phosphoesterase